MSFFGSLIGEVTSAPTTFEIISEIIKGLLTNFLITFLAVLIPLSIGIPLSLVCKKSNALSKVFGWLRLPFEIVCVPLLVMLLYYGPGILFNVHLFSGDFSRALCIVLALSFAYTMYIPARYNPDNSFLKNTLLNSFGLISAAFKWSFIGGMLIGVSDAYRAASMFMARYFSGGAFILLFIIVTVVILVLELPKTVIKQFMK